MADQVARKGLARRTLVARVALIAGIAAGLVWFQRRPLATSFIASQLASRGVQASYTVTGLGFRWQTVDNLVIGDPANPDLTAEHAEIRVNASLAGIGITDVHASGVRLKGRYINGKVSWGSIDKLLPAPSGERFALPDLVVSVADARVRLDTPYGVIAARIDGKGKLSDGFRGKMAAIMPVMTTKPCVALRPTAYVDLAISAGEPWVNGPVRAQRVTCGGTRIDSPTLAVDMTFARSLDRWHGAMQPDVPVISAGGDQLARITGAIDFDGDVHRTGGRARVGAASGVIAGQRFAGLNTDAQFVLSDDMTGARGGISIQHVRPDDRLARTLMTAAKATAGVPVAPLLARTAAIAAQTRDISVSSDFDAQMDVGGLKAQIRNMAARSANGISATVSGGDGIRFGAQGLVANTALSLSGGGLPRIEAAFRRDRFGATHGVAIVAPYAADGARLALSPVSFLSSPNGALRVTTHVAMDGPLGDGRISNLTAPIVLMRDRGGGYTINPGCTPAHVDHLSVASLSLGPTSLNLCADGPALARIAGGRISGGVRVAAPTISARLGDTPLRFAAASARYGLDGAFAADRPRLLLGSGTPTRLQATSLTGQVTSAAAHGRFAGLSGQIGTVPLLFEDGSGPWSFVDGKLRVAGSARVRDAVTVPRFNPLLARDFAMTMANGRIDAHAVLIEPAKQVRVANVSITHRLASDSGSAILDVSGLRFDKGLQPEMLTPLTNGVIANVMGSISGQGRIDWTPRGVTSSGDFSTDGTDLAAAFGPVTGIKGTIHFTDLLNLKTDSQQIRVASINPGTPVTDGVITYRLLGDQRLAIEHGEWPFAGGQLILQPTVLQMGTPSERRLTFRIVGLDAAKFVERLQFENFAASGIFDGVMPMIFNEQGGRIEGGVLSVRDPGGTLAYVGQVSNTDMNLFAKIAFDALKSMRYRHLNIDLQGPLDGEMISRVVFTGLSNADPNAHINFLVRRLLKLPIKFNITIRAPFRGLLSTAKTFQDPTLLLNDPLVTNEINKPVQPPSSEKRP